MSGADRVAAQVRDAVARGVALRVTAGGGWLDANRPVHASDSVSVAECRGIVDYVPGDFTMTVGAGTTLREIDDAARAHGQWLPLDPFGGGTIGATVATASGGPHASAFGTPRDHVLGLEFVTGTGAVARGGGRVVKNVAGFDLTRLQTGAWGTLGVITELTMRLRALPAIAETHAAPIDDVLPALERAFAQMRTLATPPFAAEVVNAALAEALALPARPMLIVRTAGNSESVRAQRTALAGCGIGDFVPIDEAVWARMSAAAAGGGAVWRAASGPASFPATWRRVAGELERAGGGWMHGSMLRGVVRCGVAQLADAQALRAMLASPCAGSRIGELLPADVWPALPSPVSDRLSRGLRRAFDPHCVLNRGIFGEAE